jgi:hypothetical protein
MAISVTPHVQRMGDVPFSVVRGPPGSNVAERLAGLIEGWDRWQRCIWLRSPKAGRDALAGPLASAFRHRWVDAAELDEGRLDVTPSTRLDETLRRSPTGAVIVLELAGRLTVDVGRLVESIRPVLADRGVSLVAVTESRHPLAFLRGAEHVVPAVDLAGPNGIEAFGGLPERFRNRRLELGGRRATVVRDVLEAAAALAPRRCPRVHTRLVQLGLRCRPDALQLAEAGQDVAHMELHLAGVDPAGETQMCRVMTCRYRRCT